MIIAESLTDTKIALNDEITLDLTTLIETRLIVQANSGGGKTWAIRRILEQSFGRVQHIIIDVEGSLRTLRERFEYLLLGSETDEVDYPISPANAAQVAIQLLEVRTSVILDLYEFLPSQRHQIVRLFLEALINAPKHLWHDCLVVIDEAHIFCPERERSEAKQAVEALCSRGRARGFCAILATQRISKLGKDALGECNNKLIGRASLDVDMKRSNAELEFPSSSQVLKRLAPGEFYVFGPAISPEVQKIAIGSVTTTHPKAGSRRQMSSPPAPASLKLVLETLRALPQLAGEDGDDSSMERAREHGASGKPSRGKQISSVDSGNQMLAQPFPTQIVSLLAEKDAEIQRLRRLLEQLSTISVSLDGRVVPVTELPSVLHLDQLNVQVQTATIEVQREPSVVSDQDGHLGVSEDLVRASRMEEEVKVTLPQGLLLSEQNLLQKLIRQVVALSPGEKVLFIWLIEHDGREVSSQELAAGVSMNVSVTQTRVTSKLVKIPFIHLRRTSKFWFKSAFGAYARTYFTSVSDYMVIAQRLVKATQGKS